MVESAQPFQRGERDGMLKARLLNWEARLLLARGDLMPPVVITEDPVFLGGIGRRM